MSLSLIESRLKDLKLIVPDLESPLGLYVPVVRTGNLLLTSGQLPKSAGKIEYRGKLGREFDVEAGKRAARLALVNALSAVKYGLKGEWSALRRAVSLRLAVASAVGFTDQAAVADAASDLLLKLLGAEHGAHARFTWGCLELPLGAAVELELVVEVN